MKRSRSSTNIQVKVSINNHVCIRIQAADDDDLPEDLLYAILVCLLVERVFMLKIVSKRWNSIISSSFFWQLYTATKQGEIASLPWKFLHQSFQNSHEHLISHHLKDKDDQLMITWPDFTFPNSKGYWIKYRVVSSSHGLLLCRFTGRTIYAVCNPITRQWFVLPRHNIRYKYSNEAFVTKIEDLGSKVISFKVIRMQLSNPSEFTTVLNMEVYDSATDKWTETKSTINWTHRISLLPSRKPVCLNGIVHWECLSSVIIAYDHIENRCWLLRSPSGRFYPSHSSLFSVWNGKLGYIEMDSNLGHTYHFWVLEDYDKGSWELKHTIADDVLSPPPTTYGYRPLAFHPFDSNIIYIVVEDTLVGKKLISYNFNTKQVLQHSNVTVPTDSHSSTVFTFVIPLWPPAIAIAKEGRRRLRVMETGKKCPQKIRQKRSKLRRRIN